MWFLIKMLFPKLWFGIDGDPESGGGDPNGQHYAGDGGNADDGTGGDQAPTEIVIGEHKTTLDELRKIEALKPFFDSHDNREKWQSENTRRAQQIKQIERDAQQFQKIRQDPQFQHFLNSQSQPTNRYEAVKQGFIQKASQRWGGQFDPEFIGSMFDTFSEISDLKAQEVVAPFQNQYMSNWEKQFLREHPLAKPKEDGYQEMIERIRNGYDPEDAYQLVYRNQILDSEFEDRLKKRDAENARKLKSSRQAGGTSGKKTVLRGDDAFEAAWSEHGGD